MYIMYYMYACSKLNLTRKYNFQYKDFDAKEGWGNFNGNGIVINLADTLQSTLLDKVYYFRRDSAPFQQATAIPIFSP